MSDEAVSVVRVPVSFSLRETCSPVAWGGGRWPNVDWLQDSLIWCGWEAGQVALRCVSQPGAGALAISGPRVPAADESWLRRVLAVDRDAPSSGDDVVEAIAQRYPGLRLFSAGSLFDGVVSSIAGQSISVASAAVTERRLAALFHSGVLFGDRRFWPMPTVASLASSTPARVRESGVTWRRAEAIVAAAQAWEWGDAPDERDALTDAERTVEWLRRLPLVGEWTARSALVWGVGAEDIFPPNDAALLRAARAAYRSPEMDHLTLNRLAAGWAPARSWAARWLWTSLLGVPDDEAGSRSV